MASARDLAAAIGAFGVEAKAKLSNPAAAGAPEDQLRGPLERLLGELSRLAGFAEGAVTPVGEFTLSDLNTRPDYAVTVNRALVGFIEVKAPGKGVVPTRFQDPHDRRQWEKLKRLPNLLYTDGAARAMAVCQSANEAFSMLVYRKFIDVIVREVDNLHKVAPPTPEMNNGS